MPPSSLASQAGSDEGGGARTTTACARIDAFGANSVWLYWRPCIAESFIRGHGGNVDEVALAIQMAKQQQRRQSFNGAQPRLQLIFNASSTGRRPHFNLAIATSNPAGNQPTFSTPLHRRFFFNTRTDGSAH